MMLTQWRSKKGGGAAFDNTEVFFRVVNTPSLSCGGRGWGDFYKLKLKNNNNPKRKSTDLLIF